MKKFIKTSLLLTTLLSAPLVSCSKDNKNDNKTEVAKVEVTGVTLDQASKSLGVGEEFTLKATIAPENATNKDVTWSSTNPEVATVDANGKVQTVSVGKAEIVAKSNNGKEAKCSINVWGLEIRAKQIENAESPKFDLTTYKSTELEYRIHKKDGTVTEEWLALNYDLVNPENSSDTGNYLGAQISDDKANINLYFNVSADSGETEVVDEQNVPIYDSFVGSIKLPIVNRIRDVSELSPSKYLQKVKTETITNDEGKEEVVEVKDEEGNLVYEDETSNIIIRGIIIEQYWGTGTSGSKYFVVKDVKTNTLFSIQTTNETQTNKLINGVFQKGDEILIVTDTSKITNDKSIVQNTIRYKTKNVNQMILLSRYNITKVDISDSTVLSTKSQLEDLFETKEKRVNNLNKLFTIPANSKQLFNVNSGSTTPNYDSWVGFGYTSDSREEYSDWGMSYYLKNNSSASTESRFVTKSGNSTLAFGSSNALYNKVYETILNDTHYSNLPYFSTKNNGAKYTYTYTNESGEEVSEERTAVLDRSNNDKDFLTTDKTITFLYTGFSTDFTSVSSAFMSQLVVVLDLDWIR